MELTSVQREDIAQAKAASFTTRRPTVPALEDVLFDAIPVLDHGFVRAVDYMGDDSAVVQAARVSYGRGTRKTTEDNGLVRYLMRHWHSTPFEMCVLKLHVKMPIFVARQWIRHRTASVNELSARYSILDNEFYVPDAAHMAAQSSTNRQGRGALLDEGECSRVMDILREDALRNYKNYEWMLNEDREGAQVDPGRSGLARELARMNLTLNTYTQWYWKVDLHNLFNFLRLRADAHAQYEIRAYADEILKLVDAWVPMSAAAFREYRLGAETVSKTEADLIRRLIAGEDPLAGETGLSTRELAAFKAAWLPADTVALGPATARARRASRAVAAGTTGAQAKRKGGAAGR